jgi:DNA adenine methylase
MCDLAAIYYFNHNTSCGPNFLGSPSSVYLQKERYEKMVKKVENFNVKNIEVKYNSFEYIIEQYKNDFSYLDPPCYLNGDRVKHYPHRNFHIQSQWL